MRLTEISLDRFRNLRSTSIGIPPAGAVLVGSNGQGKTNFLEAIHYLALFRSFRGARQQEVIAFGEDGFGVSGEAAYGDGGMRRVTVTGDRSARRIAVDGRYGSLGQQRTAAIALRLAEAEILEGETGRSPVLLLDDVFAEVDARRSRAMWPCLGAHRQRFVTSARPLPELAEELECWDVSDGRIMAPAVAA